MISVSFCVSISRIPLDLETNSAVIISPNPERIIKKPIPLVSPVPIILPTVFASTPPSTNAGLNT